MNVAQLKQLLRELAAPFKEAFPRLNERGSIEAAGSGHIANVVREFPRLNERGSIEAPARPYRQ